MRVASSPDVKTHEETKGRSDASPSQLSISKAAVQAAHNLATGVSDSTQLMSDATDEPAPSGESKVKVMLPIAAVTPRQVLDSDEEQELLSDEQPRTEGSSDSSGDKTAKSNRSAKKRGRKRLSVCETMPVSPSSALQIIINNPGKLESFYDVDQDSWMSSWTLIYNESIPSKMLPHAQDPTGQAKFALPSPLPRAGSGWDAGPSSQVFARSKAKAKAEVSCRRCDVALRASQTSETFCCLK